MIKAVIFDWSGVISDDLRLVYDVTARIFDKLGKGFMSIDEFRERFDLPYLDFYKRMGVQIGKEELDRLYGRFFVENGKKAKAFPFARKTLEWLREFYI